MDDIQTTMSGLSLVRPNPERDAPFAVEWFASEHGKETLMLMGNAESEINDTDLEKETATVQNFLDLEKSGEQLTWAIRYGGRTIGAVWIEMKATEHVRAPAVHIMIGDYASRGKGIGLEVMKTIITYAKDTLHVTKLFSRHLTDNAAVNGMNKQLGFENDGEPYADDNGLIFQNDKLEFARE